MLNSEAGSPVLWCWSMQHHGESPLSGLVTTSFLLKKAQPLSLLCHCCSPAKLCLTLCDPVACSTPGSPVLRRLPEFAQIRVH